LALVATFLLIVATLVSSPATRAFEPWSAESSGTAATLFAVSCPTDASCVAVGAGGVIQRGTTPPGGSMSWTGETSGTTNDLRGVSCAATGVCYAVGEGGTILKSATVGSWVRQTSPTPGRLAAISCPDATTCFAVGPEGSAPGNIVSLALVVATSDGTTWTAQTIPDGNQLGTIDCPTPLICHAAGPGRFFVSTVSGGAEWVTQASDTAFDITGLSCPTGLHCVAADNKPSNFLLTVNGGGVWKKTTSGLDSKGVGCANENECFSAGMGGVVQQTTDGGLNWTSVTSPTTNDLWGISCNSTTCRAVGSGGKIIGN